MRAAEVFTKDSFRFFHRLRFDGLSIRDAEQLLNMTLMGLRQMASDPDVARAGLEILADLGKTPGSFPLFQSHFHGVWRDPILPLSVITGFCRSTKAAGETTPAGLQALARPLLEDVLKQLENWDPKIVSGKSLHLTERRFCALAGLAPLEAQMDRLLVEAVQRKLSGKFPEHLLPCAAPLLAALTKAASSATGDASLNLADQICGAMAANVELQDEGGDHTLELCDALLSDAGNRCVSGGANACNALAVMCQHGVNEPGKGALVDAMAAQVMSRVLQVALGNSIDGPLMESLAELFMLCTTVTALMAAAHDLIVGITDHVVRSLVLQSFEKLNAQLLGLQIGFQLMPWAKVGFLQVQEHLAAQTAAEVVAEMVARQSSSAGEVALATRQAIVGSGWKTSSAAIASMAGKAAARAVAHHMSRKAGAKDGWQEVAKAASDAAYASLMPPAEVPRVAAETSSLEVSKAAAADGKTGEEVGLAAIAAVRAAGVSEGLSPVIASSSIALALSSCHRYVEDFTLQDWQLGPFERDAQSRKMPSTNQASMP
eukprot:s58_g26.t1